MKSRLAVLLIITLLPFLPSCGFQKILKNGTADEKYEAAIKYYNEKDYSRALQLFDQIMGAMRASDKAEKIYYYYAYCYYNQKDYTLASYYFKRYATTFPNSPQAEECSFLCAYCNYMNSPEYSLDQTITFEGLKELQLFANTYPKSKRISECNDLIDKLRDKLEYKDYKMAKLYYRMEDYAAAITSLNNIIKDFPGTVHKEEIMFLIFKSYHKFAKESIEEKKKDRHQKAIIAYTEFVAQYPESQFLTEATDLKERSKKELEMMYKKDQARIDRSTKASAEKTKTNK